MWQQQHIISAATIINIPTCCLTKLKFLGHHSHAQPPIQKPLPSELTLFKKRIEAMPNACSLKLKVGQSLNPDSFLAPIRNLSATFNNLNRIAYYHNKVIQSSEVICNGITG